MDELLKKIQALRDKRDKITEMYNEQIELLGFKLEKMMEDAGEEKHNSEHALAYFTKKKTAEVTDWTIIQTYIKEHNAFDLLEKRISVSSLEARLNAGEEIKGVSVKTGEKQLVIRRN